MYMCQRSYFSLCIQQSNNEWTESAFPACLFKSLFTGYTVLLGCCSRIPNNELDLTLVSRKGSIVYCEERM